MLHNKGNTIPYYVKDFSDCATRFLQDIVNMYLDITENSAKRQIPMNMKDW